ncbi:CdaR family transcriptional regulator [Aquitalea magnusonii]|nr:CdaR family transcriptional regulator [Aquitalea magnusonii]
MDLITALKNTILRDAKTVAGGAGLDREIKWVHMVDHPEIAQWVKSGYLLLTTGYNWPKHGESARKIVEDLAEKGLTGVVLATPNFLSNFPKESVDAANELNFPLLEIPWDVPFCDITEEIHSSIIKHQNAIIERSEEIHRQLTNAAISANTLDDLAIALSNLIKSPVTFVDLEGILLGSSISSIDRIVDEELYLRHLNEFVILRKIQDSTSPILIEKNSNVNAPQRIGYPIRIRGEMVAIIFIDETSNGFTELTFRATEHTAVIAALHMAHIKALHLQEERLGYTLVGSLLEGKFEENPSSLERARLSGWDPNGEYRVCLVLLDEPLPLTREGFLRRERWVDRLRKFLDTVNESNLISVYLNQITFLLSKKNDPEYLWKNLGGRGSAMAVSRVHRGAKGIESGAGDVNSLYPLLKSGRLHSFSEVMFPRALMGDKNARDLFIKSRLDPLISNKKGESFLETLEGLCDEGFHLANCARKLGIHISTMRYRVERIETILGMSLESKELRFELQVAVAMYKLINE